MCTVQWLEKVDGDKDLLYRGCEPVDKEKYERATDGPPLTGESGAGTPDGETTTLERGLLGFLD